MTDPRIAIVILLPFASCGGDSAQETALDGAPQDARESLADASEPSADAAPTPQCGTLQATIRDFAISHPDFEVVPAEDVVVPALVKSTITPGGKPELSAAPPAAGLITSPETFSQWYTDVPDVNISFARELLLTETPAGSGTYVYDDDTYFPIDELGFGNEGNPHNYHFTTELHASFTYEGGEVFTFRGDDDVWVYVNGMLAIDIGGVHSANERSIDFDTQASALGIEVGESYAIDFFQAERHVTGSNFRLETSISCFVVD